MKRRKLLTGLGALAAGSAAAIGTGAFSSVEADRTLAARTAADTDAFLGLSSPSSLENSEYATYKGYPEGELHLRFNNDSAVAGSGLNTDAISQFDEVFRITNNGTQPVDVWIDDSGMTFASRVTFYVDQDPSDPIENEGNSVQIGVGGSVDVGLEFDLKRADDENSVILSPGQLIASEDEVTINAEEV